MRSRFTLVLIFTLLIAKENFSQHLSSGAAQRIFTAADKAFDRADYLNAYELYIKGLKIDSTVSSATFRAAVSLYKINKTDSVSIKLFETASKEIPESHFYLGMIFHLQGQTKKSLVEFYHFKKINNGLIFRNTEVELWIQKCELSILAEAEKALYEVRNLGSTINSEHPEYVPLIWPLNGNLIFTSRRPGSTGGLLDPYDKYYEDIYVSEYKSKSWSKPKALSDVINGNTHDACVAFSADGKELIIYRTDESKMAGDLYTTVFDGTKWTSPVKMVSQINSPYLEASACYNNYGNEIIFSSNRPGGYGGKDLYRCIRFMNGKYSLPHNLGPDVNTTEDEDAPFIDKDNTLYFSSKGHNSIGEYDIFKAAYNSQNNKWASVENMGRPINSTNDDIYFVKSPEFHRAYFSSRREGGYGDADIYEVDFASSIKKIVYYKISSGTDNSKNLGDVQVSLIDSETGKLEGLYHPDNRRINSILLVNKDKQYDLKIEGSNINTLNRKITFNEKDQEIELVVQSRK